MVGSLQDLRREALREPAGGHTFQISAPERVTPQRGRDFGAIQLLYSSVAVNWRLT